MAAKRKKEDLAALEGLRDLCVDTVLRLSPGVKTTEWKSRECRQWMASILAIDKAMSDRIIAEAQEKQRHKENRSRKLDALASDNVVAMK